MKNYMESGDVLTLTAPYDRLSGQMAKIGAAIIAVACSDILSGASGEWLVEGVVKGIAKLSTDVVAIGDKLYWDNTNKRLTTTSTSNTLAGVAMSADAGSGSTIDIRLNGSF